MILTSSLLNDFFDDGFTIRSMNEIKDEVKLVTMMTAYNKLKVPRTQ